MNGPRMVWAKIIVQLSDGSSYAVEVDDLNLATKVNISKEIPHGAWCACPRCQPGMRRLFIDARIAGTGQYATRWEPEVAGELGTGQWEIGAGPVMEAEVVDEPEPVPQRRGVNRLQVFAVCGAVVFAMLLVWVLS